MSISIGSNAGRFGNPDGAGFYYDWDRGIYFYDPSIEYKEVCVDKRVYPLEPRWTIEAENYFKAAFGYD